MQDNTIPYYLCQAVPGSSEIFLLHFVKACIYSTYRSHRRQDKFSVSCLCYIYISLIRHIFDPVSVIALQKCRHAFKDLICIQAAYHHCRRCLDYKCHKHGQRDHDPPGTDQVHLHGISNASASPDDTTVCRHLIGHSYHYYT